MLDRVSRHSGVGQTTTGAPRNTQPRDKSKFAGMLEQVVRRDEPLRLSGHAQKRLDASATSFTDSDMLRVDRAVERAAQKGSDRSLIVLDNLALVVSIRNRVVITAVDAERMREGVFTNIDSVVIA